MVNGKTVSVAGTFVYTPAAGSVLGVGNQTLRVSFTPNDTTDYTSAAGSATLTVCKATTSLSNLTASQTIPYRDVGLLLTGKLNSNTAAVPSGETVTIKIGNLSQTASIMTNGMFSAIFLTSQLQAGSAPYAITYQYGGDANFAGVSNTATTLTIRGRRLRPR